MLNLLIYNRHIFYYHTLSELTIWSQATQYPQGYWSAGAALTFSVGKAVHNSSLCYALSYRNGQKDLLVDRCTVNKY